MLSTVIYEQLKFWLPVISGFLLTYKGFKSFKTSVDDWAAKLFDNHLSHIQTATMSTVDATNKTNDLLAASALKDIDVARRVEDARKALDENESKRVAHEEKEMLVWHGVVNTLTVLEDRSRIKTPRRTVRRRS